MSTTQGFVPPPYPYERLDRFIALAGQQPGGMVDLSIGTPCDPPPAVVVQALGGSGAERGYPPSIGTAALQAAIQRWLLRRFEVEASTSEIAACIGTKEFVGTLPQWMKLRTPNRDVVLFPAVSYPTY
jgi:aspartate/methionine/tyrosine aminotransferase